MSQRKSLIAVFAVTAALILLGSCAWPTDDPATLKAINAESQMLMKAYPTDAEVPKARWPHAIASLEPELVSINSAGVHITTKPHFDGGWGYFVPRRGQGVPEPVERFEEVGHGVYWWHPY